TLHELRAINRTFLVDRHRRRRGHTSLANLPDIATLRITSAAQEWTKTTTLQLHRLAAQVACLRFGCFFTRGLRLARTAVAIRRGRRFRIARRFAVETFQVRTKASPLLDHARRVALQADLLGWNVLLFNVFDVTLKLLQVSLKLVVELAQRFGPTDLPFLDFVKLFFHARGVSLIEEIVEAAVDQKIVDGLAERGRMKASLQLLDVLALLNRRHDRGVSRRPSNPLLFERLHECCFRVARRRLSEVLFGRDGIQFEVLAFFD